jgi:glycosyltransferase involved in cell wall biosynthesis
MKILSLAPTSFFGDYGCHVRILEEARALKALGHDVTILTYYKGQDVPGFQVIRSAPTPWHKDYEVGSSRHKFAFDALLAVRLLRVLAKNKFDVIHAHLHEGALIAGVLAKFWRIPVCFDYQGSLTDEMKQHGFVRRQWAVDTASKLERFVNRLPHAIFTSTKNAAEGLQRELGAGKPVKLVHHLPDGVNAETFTPHALSPDERIALRAVHGIGPDEPVVAFLGLLARHQGIANLIEAAALVKQQGNHVRWLVMGYPGVNEWRTAAAQAGVGDELVFTGRVPYAQAPRMLAMGDIAIAPKLSLTEGSGKLLNYMAMGLPTAAFDTPGQREYLGNLGVYAPMGDSQALARQVLHLLDHPEQRRALGEKLRLRARQHFGWDRGAVLMENVYKQLTHQPVRRAVSCEP